MNKIILLGGSDSFFSNKTLKLFFYLIGLFYLIFWGLHLYSEFNYLSNVVWLALGVFYSFYGTVIFTKTSISPQMAINDVEIKFKKTVFNRFTKLNWSDVVSIEFGNYEINFQLTAGIKKFKYESNPDVSLEIKRSIRVIADKRGVEIIGR